MIELSKICRLGSGSACRSLYGGFVEWEKGDLLLNNSYAYQLYPETYWPEIKCVIIVLNENKKKVSSSVAMKRTKETSELIKYRCDVIVSKRIEELKKALKEKNFEKLCEITMKDSNEFHSTCLDSYPPIHYLSNDSYKIIDIIHIINEYYEKTIFGYTFDAGPNAVILTENNNINLLIQIIQYMDINTKKDIIFEEKLINKINEYKDSINCLNTYISEIGTNPIKLNPKNT